MRRITPLLFVAALLVSAAVVAGRPGGQDSDVTSDTTHTAPTAVDMVFPPPAVFDHEFHIDDAELDCVECHHETDAAALVTPHEQYFEDLWITCSTCHRGEDQIAGPQACDECHKRSPSGIADQLISVKVATHISCWECHESGTGAEASENCGFCHQEVDEP